MGKNAPGPHQHEHSPPDIQSWYLDSLESAPFGVLIHDQNGKILFFNKTLEELTGYSRNEIPDIQAWVEKAYPDESYRNLVQAERENDPDAERLRVRETIVTCKDGTKHPCRFSSRTAPSGIRTVTVQPADGEWNALANAIAGYEKLQTQFYSTPTPLMAWIPSEGDFVLAACNKAAERLTSGKIGSCIGKSVRDIFETPASLVACMRRSYEKQTNVECTEPCRLPGVDSDYQYDITLLFMPPKYVVMHISTRSELNRAREYLLDSERSYKELVDMLPITIFEVDAAGNYVYINRQGLKLLGFSPQDLEGLNSVDLIVEEDRARARENFAKVVSGRNTGPNSYTARVAGGRTIPVTLHTTRVLQGGSVIGLRGYVIDESERRKTEEALKKAYAEVEDLVAERTGELEAKSMELLEVNTALRVLLRDQQAHRREMEEQVRSNARELVRPHLDKLQKSRLSERQHVWLRQALSSLENITSPLGHTISNHYEKLTPTELQVADLIKSGKTSKEIAGILDLAVRTIESHRKNIRAKLGLKNRKVNLRTHLLTL